MRAIRFDPEKDLASDDDRAWWAAWSERARKATGAAIGAWEVWLDSPQADPFKHKFDDAVWGDLKRFLLPRVFFNKCAYCESRLVVTDVGDAEHYRPKGQVTVKSESGKAIVAIPVGKPGAPAPTRRQHPGYFWLAYDWRNLMPACRLCNSVHGKVDQFPVALEHQLMIPLAGLPADAYFPSEKWPGYGYPRGEWLDMQEKPSLLSPVNPREEMDPRKHLRFGVRGIVTHLEGSELGERTIRILDLDRDSLNEARANAQELAWKRYKKGFEEPADREECRRKAKAEIQDFLAGRAQYSRAAIEAIEDAWGPIG